MSEFINQVSAKFITTHYVNATFHKQHSQLIHRHDSVIELLYVINGHGSYRISNREYIAEPGTLFICNEGVLHGEEPFLKHSMQSCCCVLENLKVPNLPPNTLTAASQNPVLHFSANRLHIENFFLALHEYNLQSPVYNNVCEILANALLNIVYIEVQKQNSQKTIVDKNKEELIQYIMEYLNEHFMEEISLQELGEIFHISHYHLSHIFKTAIGVSPRKYIIHRKIGEAQNLLMNTDLLIGEIVERVGFNENCHFSSMFKKYVGVTPTQYRIHFKKKKSEDRTEQKENL